MENFSLIRVQCAMDQLHVVEVYSAKENGNQCGWINLSIEKLPKNINY
jgi:hypothetical protein